MWEKIEFFLRIIELNDNGETPQEKENIYFIRKHFIGNIFSFLNYFQCQQNHVLAIFLSILVVYFMSAVKELLQYNATKYD